MTDETTPGDPPDETDLVAYLDGELDPDRAKKVEADLALDPTARAEADALRKSFDLLDYLPRTEPSPTFASRTLTRIEPGAAPTGPYLPTQSTSAPMQQPPQSWWPAAWLAAAVLAAGGGFLASAVAPSTPTKPELSIADMTVIERLPLYLGVDDLDFVRKLEASELFPPDADDPPPAAAPPPPNRDKLITLFESFPPNRQRQLRELHDQFTKLEPATAVRLNRVLERYAVWLDGLPDTERREILAAPTGGERADEVQRKFARSVRAGLPVGVRKQIDQTPDKEDQTQLVMAYRKREADHRDGWELARRQWNELKEDRRPWPLSDAGLTEQIEKYVKDVLKPRLTNEEKQTLERLQGLAKLEIDPDRRAITAGVMYAAYLYSYTDAHPIYPEFGPGAGKTIRTTDDAKLEYRQVIRRLGELRLFSGVPNRWPDVAEVVAAEARRQNVTLRPQPGPSRPGEFTKELNEAVAKFEAEKWTPGERAEMRLLLGKWPDYPRRLIELARKYDVALPGVPTLPGSSALWAKYYGPVRGPKK